MTHLHTRKLRFGFADAAVPYLWNPSDPAFSSATNAMSFFFIAVEKMIVAAVNDALPLITDSDVADEARAFVRQEAQHTLAHRQHAKGLIKTHPPLKETLDEMVSTYEGLTARKSLHYRLAYIADLEATFTPSFKLMLDNADTLFAPGDDRVASLFVWHFVEEVEHRSSALRIYDAVVKNRWYRMRVAPSVFAHAGSVMVKAAEGFNRHVPTAIRKVDAGSMFGNQRWKTALTQRFPSAHKLPFIGSPKFGPFGKPYPHVPLREQAAAAFGVFRSQIPGHNPARQKLPALAAEWLARYDAGYDVTRWYTAAGNQPA
ncbi:metal-dependent hydrolase [Mycobacterium sp. M26]|uniref:metal-dependent hydrolase n=1 Tax=Mycobacterium sp. M26 TaxID=1762962 RepID=UPI00073F94F5|nr:metal-dependent hydrolase [Mycobacterium sp. M26]